MPQKDYRPGVLVRGKTLGVTGAQVEKRINVTPERAIVFEGVVYSAVMQPVPVAADGTWEVRLPPGRYQFQIGNETFTAVVPAGATAVAFTEIIIYD